MQNGKLAFERQHSIQHILMKKELTFIFTTIIALVLIMASCTLSPNKASDISQIDDTQPAPDEIGEVEEIKQKLHFNSAEDAIRYMNDSKDAQLYSQGILPQMAIDSVEYCQKLLNSEYDYFIIVDKQDMRVKLYDRYGRLKKSYKCACGKNYGNKRKKGDCRTPEGFFQAGSVKNSANWHYTDENGKRSEKPGQYGPRFIRIVTPGYSSTGIHGTDAPWSIGARRSHGCIRIKNENILELANFVTKGMPIIVLPSEKDKEVNEREMNPNWEETHKDDSVSTLSQEHHAAATDSISSVATDSLKI